MLEKDIKRKKGYGFDEAVVLLSYQTSNSFTSTRKRLFLRPSVDLAVIGSDDWLIERTNHLSYLNLFSRRIFCSRPFSHVKYPRICSKTSLISFHLQHIQVCTQQRCAGTSVERVLNPVLSSITMLTAFHGTYCVELKKLI